MQTKILVQQQAVTSVRGIVCVSVLRCNPVPRYWEALNSQRIFLKRYNGTTPHARLYSEF